MLHIVRYLLYTYIYTHTMSNCREWLTDCAKQKVHEDHRSIFTIANNQDLMQEALQNADYPIEKETIAQFHVA